MSSYVKNPKQWLERTLLYKQRGPCSVLVPALWMDYSEDAMAEIASIQYIDTIEIETPADAYVWLIREMIFQETDTDSFAIALGIESVLPQFTARRQSEGAHLVTDHMQIYIDPVYDTAFEKIVGVKKKMNTVEIKEAGDSPQAYSGK